MRSIQARFLTVVALAALAGLLAGCDGSSGGGGTVDLTGWWKVRVRPHGTPDPYEDAALWHMEQEGSTVLVFGTMEFTVSGSDVTGCYPDGASADRTEFYFTIVSNDLLAGEVVTYEMGVESARTDTELVRTEAPDGTFTATGTVASVAIDFTDTQAIAYVELVSSDVVWVQLNHLVDASPSFLLTLDRSAGIAVAQYQAGEFADIDVMAVVNQSDVDIAASGTVDITLLTADRVAGGFDLTMEGGGTLVGSFDCPVVQTIDSTP